MIANEEEKRSHLRGIIEKLKSQKDEHSSVIGNLISENDQLSREVLQSEREVGTYSPFYYLYLYLYTYLEEEELCERRNIRGQAARS